MEKKQSFRQCALRAQAVSIKTSFKPKGRALGIQEKSENYSPVPSISHQTKVNIGLHDTYVFSGAISISHQTKVNCFKEINYPCILEHTVVNPEFYLVYSRISNAIINSLSSYLLIQVYQQLYIYIQEISIRFQAPPSVLQRKTNYAEEAAWYFLRFPNCSMTFFRSLS